MKDIILCIGLESGFTLELCMGLAVTGLEDAKPEVRQAATEVVVLLEEIAGSSIMKFIEKIPKRTLAEVENAIAANHEKGE